MITPKYLRLEYVETIGKLFPDTKFQFHFNKDGELKESKHRTYNELSYKHFFVQKDIWLRTKLITNHSDELVLDFDNKLMNDNIREVRLVIKKLLEIGIDKFEIYLSGGKGIHLTFRYDYYYFIEWGDRSKVRKEIFDLLQIDVNIDKLLFRTEQMLGLEGYVHRKTLKPKLRIKVNEEGYEVLNDQLNFDYLTDDYVNDLPEYFIEKVLFNLRNKKHNTTEYKLDLNKKTNYNLETFERHLKRFKELYFNEEVGNSKNRFIDCVTRYIYLTTKDETKTIYFLEIFCDEVGLNYDILDRVQRTISSITAPAIFIYKDVLTKEKFYENWNLNSVVSSDANYNEQNKQKILI